LTLVFAQRDYEIDLERGTLMAWLEQIGNKTWATPEILGDLALAWTYMHMRHPDKIVGDLEEGRGMRHVSRRLARRQGFRTR